MAEIIPPTKLAELYGSTKAVVREENGCFELKTPSGYWYQVDCNRCDSTEKLLGWILHLAPKKWVTHSHIEELILRASDKFPAIKIVR